MESEHGGGATGFAREPLHPTQAIAAGWRTFLANAWISIGALLLLLVICLVGEAIPVLGFLFGLLVMPALMVGGAGWLLRRARGGRPAIGTLFDGFQRWPAATGAYLMIALVVLLLESPLLVVALVTLGVQSLVHYRDLGSSPAWTAATIGSIGLAAVVVVPLITWWTCRMGMFYFVVMEDDRPGAMAALRRSWELTRGSTWRLVGLGLLAIPVALLGVIALCVGVIPAYVTLAYAWVDAYEQLRRRAGGAPTAPAPATIIA